MVDMGHLNSQHSGTNSFSRDINNSHVRSPRGALACMINSEIGAVLAVMRRNVRWGVRYASDEDQLDHPLILSLKELRKQIFSWKNQWHNINPTLYLQPFLDVIQSDETGAPITGVALSSIYKVLTLDMLDLNTVNVEEAMHKIIDAVTSCRFEVTDPGSEEVVLMKILQVLLACMKSKVSVKLSNQHVCNIINSCFRVVHQASSKGELLQRIARHTMHELVRCIFSYLPYIKKDLTNGSSSYHSEEVDTPNTGCTISGSKENTSIALAGMLSIERGDANKNLETDNNGFQAAQNDEKLMMEPFGVPCMVEILYFLCSLLNAIEHTDIGSRLSPIAYDEDVPLFALGLINSAIELGGPSFSRHPKLLSLIQDELFRNLMKFGLSMSPLILSMVSSIVLNLYQHLRTELKVQLEAFFSFVLLQIAESKHGSFYQRQEVAMEALVDLCRQETFMAEMFANFDCDLTSSNVFEDVASLLSKSAFPVNEPLSAMHTLALDGLLSMIHGISERIGQESYTREELSTGAGYMPFWTLTCESFDDPNKWAPFVRKMKNIKRRLAVGADHFNRDPKKGLEFAQGVHLLPDELNPQSVAYFFRYTAGLDKNLIGDYLGNHDEFCVKVLHEFARTFDFEGMNLDIGLRLFLGTFRLPGESQKIQRVLEAFAGRYYEQSPHIFNDKDAALLLSYSLIMLNTDQHNLQVKKKMTKEDFIRNNRHINGGNDLPREYLSELYQSICENEIQMIPDQGANYPGITSSRWINVMHKSRSTTPFIFCNSKPILDYDMFGILSGPTIAALSVVFDQAEQEDVLETCVNGFLAIAKISASYNSGQLLDDLVVSLCRFANFETQLSVDDAILSFGEDIKARMATSTIFIIANTYGDYIRSSWKNILDCVLSFHKLGVLPAHLVTDATDGLELLSDTEHARLTNSFRKSQITSTATPRKSSGLIGRFSQFLSFEVEEPQLQPTEEQLVAQNQTRETIQSWHIDSIFMESKFLQADSLLQLVQALISAATRFRKGGTLLEDENTAVFCLELLIALALNNRDRIMLIWEAVFDHISNIVQSTVMPCNLVEKAVFGLLKICQRLLPYKENLTNELLKSLQLILKLDARVADAYCEPITIEVNRLVKANATHIRSHMGWRTVTSLLSITARHPEASEVGFETLVFIMSDGAHLFPSNYVLCIDAARQFAESRLVEIDRSLTAIDLIGNSVTCLICWSSKAKSSISDDEAKKVSQDIGEMWLRLVQALKKVCLDQREEIRNHSILMLQRSLTSVDPFQLPTPNTLWFQCFDLVIFPLLDELLEMSQSKSLKMEGTLVLSMKLMSKSFLQVLHALSQQPNFCKLWLGVLQEMEKYMKVKLRGRRSEKIHELVPELLKNTLLVMKTTGILMKSNDIGADSFWQLTWLHVKNICPTLELEVFPDGESENLFEKHVETLVFDGTTV